MAYNKKAHLNDNIEAIKTAFRLEKEQRKADFSEREILSRYSGFGGLKCILNPARTLEDAARWKKSELELFPLVGELHRIIREHAADEKQYTRYVDSLKQSVLTAFYTPPAIVESIADALRNSGVTPARLLEPSAGTGAFVAAFTPENSAVETVAFEKDLLTGKILKALYPDADVRIEGFENIEAKNLNKFDLVTSNIPFGDVSVFDLSFSRGNSLAKQQAARSVHNYFFLKGLDSLQEGGVLAFITSQGVMNSERNALIREYLMANSRLVSAVRLPNNLFSDYAGTEVGTDLIILQKQSGKTPDNEREILFVESEKIDGISQNLFFDSPEKIIHTRQETGTDMYGNPAVVYHHDGGIDGIAEELQKVLTTQIRQSGFDLSLFNGNEPKQTVSFSGVLGQKIEHQSTIGVQSEPEQPQQSSNQEEPLLTLYDLFGFSTQERTQVASPKKGQKGQKGRNALPERLQPVSQKSEQKIGVPVSEVKQSTQPVQTAEKTVENSTTIDTQTQKEDVYTPPLPTTEQVIEEFFARQDPFSISHGFVDEWRLEIQHEARLAKAREAAEALNSTEINDDKSENLPKPTVQNSLFEETQSLSFEPRPYPEKWEPHYREGCLIADNGQVGYLKKDENDHSIFNPLNVSSKQQKRIESYILVRNAYKELYDAEAESKQANSLMRSDLNRFYDYFTEKYGRLNTPENLKIVKMDTAGHDMSFLERNIGGVWQKADIFSRPVSFSTQEITKVDTVEEALSASLNKFGRVDLDYMADLHGSSREELKTELHGRVFFNPLEQDYEIADRFISGNVVEKAKQVENYLKNHPDDTESAFSLKALQNAFPQRIEFEELDFNLGERWIPAEIYSRFASDLFDTQVSIRYVDSLDDFSINCPRKNMNIWTKFATRSDSRTYDGIALLKHALVNTTPEMTKTVTVDGKETKVRDGEAIQAANAKIDEIRDAFSEWLQVQNGEFKERLTTMYNNKFNCFVRPQYDGSLQTFPGLNRQNVNIEDLYGSQKDAVWMLKMNGGGICDHEVGAGKTLIMCCASQEMKRLGLANKPMIIALKANVQEIAETYRKAYPDAKVLYPGKADFTPDKRQRIFGDIKNNDWDCVILSHEQFAMIPQSPEIQQEILQQELDSVEENLEVLRSQGHEISRAMEKGLIVRQNNLEVKLKTLAYDIANRKDDVTDFKMMGIDHLFVDESHYPNKNKIQTIWYNYL